MPSGEVVQKAFVDIGFFILLFIAFLAIIEGVLYLIVAKGANSSPLVRIGIPVVVAVLGAFAVIAGKDDKAAELYQRFLSDPKLESRVDPILQATGGFLDSSQFKWLIIFVLAELMIAGLIAGMKWAGPLGIVAITVAAVYNLNNGRGPREGFLINEWPFVLIAGFAMLLMILGAVTQPKVSFAYMLIAPSVIAVALLVIYPFVYTIYLSFTNADRNNIVSGKYNFSLEQAGKNYGRIFSDPLLGDVNSGFFNLFGITILWTLINVVAHVVGGMVLALLLNREMRFKGIYRTILILPWAIPGVIAALAFRGEFNSQYGFINNFLRTMGFENVPNWQTDSNSAFIMVCIVNIWLGIPFMMISILGGLQSISREYYEAAEIDGANGWQQFRTITVPLIQPVLTPIIVLGTVWTFNNFNVVYLVDNVGKTNILVTGLFRMFNDLGKYAGAAAFSLVIFVILVVFAIGWIRFNGGLKGVYES